MSRASCPGSMGQNRLLVKAYAASDSTGAAGFSGYCQFRLPDFWSWNEERLLLLLLLREEALMETTEVCRQNLIHIQFIDLPWLITGRSIKTAAAYYWKKTLIHSVSDIKNQINHLHVAAGGEIETFVFAYWHQALLKILLISFLLQKSPRKAAIQCQRGSLLIHCISLIIHQ